MADEPYVCGVDAGGSKSECAVCTANGTVLGAIVTSAAPFTGGEGDFGAVLKRVVEEACEVAGVEVGDLGAVVAGIAGVDTPALKELAHEAVGPVFPFARVEISNDATIALEAATSDRPAGVLMGGTGSIAYGEDAAGAAHRVGGWGHVFGDEGSGYDIAVRAVSSVLRAADGRGAETSLRARVINHFSLTDPREVMGLSGLAARDPRMLAAFAPQVFEAEREGDAVAGQIISRAADELAEMGIRLLDLIGSSEAAVLALGGSLLRHDARYAGLVEERIRARRPEASIVRSALPPVTGGLLKGVASLGGHLESESLRQTIAEGLERARADVAGQNNHRRPM
jgi:N-acetylglucosamine kinase-like BadF-type ATPase